MNIHTFYEYNGLKSLMNYNDRNDIEINENIWNGDLSSGIDLINSHTLYLFN